ncbi:ketohexokinase-like [Gigantopelta aegis]|uniref:ketohexokinase-like n=1 Tax=Gigantopelta aegis TaxID=1735272 RepID=UPI001B88AAB5|nr:ketohexokinase-like [Gigantopelta aegis]XP_041352686.1 ketohexokinase-like [Gigantopelta aegis]
MTSHRKTLCVGLVCVDIINIVHHFPTEDSDTRCLDCLWQRGGNASNTSSIIALLGEPSEFMGTLGDSKEIHFLQEDFANYGICTDNCVGCRECCCPLSIVILNSLNGSRTILHTNKNLPELTLEDFSKIDLNTYKWIHFEARPSCDEIKKMLQRIDEYNKGTDHILHTSVELEKPERPQANILFDMAEYVFVSKQYAMQFSCNTMTDAVQCLFEKCRPGASIICAWGELGAAAMNNQIGVVTCPAFPPEKVVDTLGAGDTFVGGTIYALGKGLDLKKSITFGCKVAGAKCGLMGNKHIKNIKLHV